MKRLKFYLLACLALLFWQASLSAQNTFAPEPPATDGFQFVSNSGLDTNSGLAPGDAKLTVSGACAALPSGNSGCTAGSGVIFLAPSFSGIIPTITASGITLSRAAFNGAFATYSSAHTLGTSDSWANVTGTTTIKAPHAIVGQRWTVFNAGTNTITLEADNTPTGSINGAASISLGTLTGADVNCDGTNCWARTSVAAGTPTLTIKQGSGGGAYTTASVAYVDVDATNLAYMVTIPSGWKLLVQANGTIGSITAAIQVNVGIYDSVANNVTAIQPTFPTATISSTDLPFVCQRLIVGDGLSHTVKLQYETSNASDSAWIANSATSTGPNMIFTLAPSN